MTDYAAYSDAKLKGAQNTMEIKENNSRAAMVTHQTLPKQVYKRNSMGV